MQNLTIINSTNHLDILLEFAEGGLLKSGAHFTNGTYAAPKVKVIPTTLAGFKRVMQVAPNAPLIIAVNSDKSMKALGKEGFDSQIVRARKVAEPLAQTFPESPVFVMFYDEQTPAELYKKLASKGLTKTLHKWGGYGIGADPKKIEGAENFELVYAFPFPDGSNALCLNETDRAKEPQKIIIEDLTDSYITTKDKVCFKLPESLAAYENHLLGEAKASPLGALA